MRVAASDDLSSSDLAARAGQDLERVRARRPRVHALINPVAANLAANLLLAAGAVPSMTADAEAMPDFIRSTSALLVNLGMLEPGRLAAARRAAPLAREAGKPWVLDPVKVDRSGGRLETALGLLAAGPTLLRCNRDEAAALAGASTGSAALLAGQFGCTVAVTGEVDQVSDGRRGLRLANGSPLMDRVTGMGCAGSALLAAFLAVDPDPFLATASGLLVLGVAGELAESRANGPGSFVPAFLDAVYALDSATLMNRARLA